MTKQDYLASTKKFIHSPLFRLVGRMPIFAQPITEKLCTKPEHVMSLLLYALIQEDMLDEAAWQEVFDTHEKIQQERATCE